MTFHVACVLVHGFALPDSEVLEVIREWNRGCQPPWSEAELIHKVRSAANVQDSKPRGFLLSDNCSSETLAWRNRTRVVIPVQAKPAICPMVLRRVANKVIGVHNVVEFIKSRSVLPVDAQDSASFLRRMYPNGCGEKVLVFSRMKSQGQMLWNADRSGLILNEDFPVGPDGVWFLPQPVDGRFHPNTRENGKMSRRSAESVTAWRYLVLESDKAERDDWLRCLIQMPLRITSICESGGRSIHSLVKLDAMCKADWDAKVGILRPGLITLGADPGALSAVRLTRLPQARRGENIQRLIYINPTPDGTPIFGQRSRSEGVA